MDAEQAFKYVETCGLMAGLRGHFPPDTALRVTEVLMSEGIIVFEMTMNSDRALEAMQAVKRAFGDDACVGMGTVLDVAQARQALEAGANFVVSPAFSPAVVREVQAADVLVAPGVITPTECVEAWALGVRLLKLFPIGPLGVEYLQAIRGPLDHMKFMCNGGTSDLNVGAFLKAGAVACGLGSWLTGDGHMPLDAIRDRARRLRQIVRALQTGVSGQTV